MENIINHFINVFEKENIKINNLEEFKQFILDFNGYSLLEGYVRFFDKNTTTQQITTDDLMNLYRFNTNFATHLFKEILIFEKKVNTYVVYSCSEINNIKDSLIFNVEHKKLESEIFPNIDQITPFIPYPNFIHKLVRFLDNQQFNRFRDFTANQENDISVWKDIPLDIMCLTWSFATTFNFFIAMNNEVKYEVLKKFGIGKNYCSGFTTFIQNSINIRNSISHNIPIFNKDIKYDGNELVELYNSIFDDKITEFKFPHYVRIIGKITNNERLLPRTIEFIRDLKINESGKQQLLKHFAI